MASILELYGIKEVAGCTFYEINSDGTPGNPVLFLDALKVTTLEQSATTVYANGGKGNPRLIGWDSTKEITLNIEDALFSPKSMAIMFGNGTVDTTMTSIRKTLEVIASKAGAEGLPTTWTDANGKSRPIPEDAALTDETGKTIEDDSTIVKGQHLFMTFDVPIAGQQIVVGPNTFPGSYYITGDTYARNETTGKDEYFQIIIEKGKVTSENTINMEADGDPSTFSMNVDVLRSASGVMIRLVKYDLEDTPDPNSGS